MMIPDELLERFAGEYTQKSTSQWGMTFQEFLKIKMEAHEEVQKVLLEMSHGEKK